MTMDMGRDACARFEGNASEQQFDAATEFADTLTWEEMDGTAEYVLFDNCILRF